MGIFGPEVFPQRHSNNLVSAEVTHWSSRVKFRRPENKKKQHSFNYRNSPACHIRAPCFLSTQWERKSSSLHRLFFSGLLTLHSGSSQVAISWDGGCSWTMSCFIKSKQSRSYHSINNTCWLGASNGLLTCHCFSCLVSWMLLQWHEVKLDECSCLFKDNRSQGVCQIADQTVASRTAIYYF